MSRSTVQRVKDWQARNPEKVRAYKRKWNDSNPEKIYEKNKRYRRLKLSNVREWKRKWRALHPEKNAEYKRTAWSNHPEKIKARNAVYYAVRSRTLIRPDHCSKCFQKCKPQGHHHRGYEFALDVIWLCDSCHSLEHKELLPPMAV